MGAYFSRSTEATPQVIMYLHGGGYIRGSARAERMLTAALARVTGRAVLSVNYRLAPEHPFPAALEDALAIYRWLLTTDVEPRQLIVAGTSAGGGLALATLVALRDAGAPCPQEQFCFLLLPISLPVVPRIRPTSREV